MSSGKHFEPPKRRSKAEVYTITMSGADAAVLNRSKRMASLPGSHAVMSVPVAHGEEDDFDQLVRTHRPRILRFLTGTLGDRDAAEDLTQECFLRAHQASSTFRGDSAVATWLIRIAINLATDYQRSRRLQFWRMLMRTREQTDLADLAERFADSSPGAERKLIARQQVAKVSQAVNKLSQQQRSIFLLRFVEELGLADIAAATGLAEGTVKTHLHRAVQAVREAVREG